MKIHIEKIVCPECKLVQKAKVEHTIPFWTYVHKCKECGFMITESDWQIADKTWLETQAKIIMKKTLINYGTAYSQLNKIGKKYEFNLRIAEYNAYNEIIHDIRKQLNVLSKLIRNNIKKYKYE